MKKILAAAVLGVVLAAIPSFSEQVNPTANVLGDTAKTGGTLVLRNSSGTVDAAAVLTNETIITAHIKTNSVITAHTYLDLTATRILCVKTNKQIGECVSGVGVNQSVCDCR